jgi:hypothetical protein
MLNTIKPRAAFVGDAFLTASRQVWLAGLGAAVVTRDWAEKEGGTVFRTLVREGTAVESKAVRFVGDRLESSFTQANMMWKRARRTVTTTVKTYADTAATLVRETLPASLPKVAVVGAAKPAKPAAKRRAAKKAAPATSAKRVKRTVKAAAKRA